MGKKDKETKEEGQLTRIAIVNAEKCKPSKCRQECKKSCPVVRMGKFCIEVGPKDKIAFLSEELCIGCGACTQVCPTRAIHLEDRDGMRSTIITGTVVREQPLLTCSECGAPTQTPAHREYVRARLPGHMAALLERERPSAYPWHLVRYCGREPATGWHSHGTAGDGVTKANGTLGAAAAAAAAAVPALESSKTLKAAARAGRRRPP